MVYGTGAVDSSGIACLARLSKPRRSVLINPYIYIYIYIYRNGRVQSPHVEPGRVSESIRFNNSEGTYANKTRVGTGGKIVIQER